MSVSDEIQHLIDQAMPGHLLPGFKEAFEEFSKKAVKSLTDFVDHQVAAGVGTAVASLVSPLTDAAGKLGRLADALDPSAIGASAVTALTAAEHGAVAGVTAIAAAISADATNRAVRIRNAATKELAPAFHLIDSVPQAVHGAYADIAGAISQIGALTKLDMFSALHAGLATSQGVHAGAGAAAGGTELLTTLGDLLAALQPLAEATGWSDSGQTAALLTGAGKLLQACGPEATQLLASAFGAAELEVITDAQTLLADAAGAKADLAGWLARPDVRRKLIIAAATLQGVSLFLKTLEVVLPIEVGATEAQAAGVREEGAAGGAAGVEGDAAVAAGEGGTAAAGVRPGSLTQKICAPICMVLDKVAVGIDGALKAFPAQETA
ncbi:MAG TPA: hypothetical protein VHE35_00120 [Kofleriaceae bacterium]|nr:hypothetical protein [Kofleriaceae bacterium]